MWVGAIDRKQQKLVLQSWDEPLFFPQIFQDSQNGNNHWSDEAT